MTTKKNAAREKLIRQLATDVLHIDSIDTRNSDRLDFPEVAVWNLRDALEAAYEAGRAKGYTDGQRAAA